MRPVIGCGGVAREVRPGISWCCCRRAEVWLGGEQAERKWAESWRLEKAMKEAGQSTDPAAPSPARAARGILEFFGILLGSRWVLWLSVGESHYGRFKRR